MTEETEIDWECSQCTFINKTNPEFCELCGQPNVEFYAARTPHRRHQPNIVFFSPENLNAVLPNGVRLRDNLNDSFSTMRIVRPRTSALSPIPAFSAPVPAPVPAASISSTINTIITTLIHQVMHDIAHTEPHDTAHAEPHAEPHDEPHDTAHAEPHDEPHDAAHAEPHDAAHAEPHDTAHDTAHAEPHAEPHDEPHAEPHDEPHAEPDAEPHDEPDAEPHASYNVLYNASRNIAPELIRTLTPRLGQNRAIDVAVNATRAALGPITDVIFAYSSRDEIYAISDYARNMLNRTNGDDESYDSNEDEDNEEQEHQHEHEHEHEDEDEHEHEDDNERENVFIRELERQYNHEMHNLLLGAVNILNPRHVNPPRQMREMIDQMLRRGHGDGHPLTTDVLMQSLLNFEPPSRRTDESEYENFKKHTVTKEFIETQMQKNGTHPTCTICYNDLEENDVVAELTCGHLFHCQFRKVNDGDDALETKNCLTKWLDDNNTCPCCKKEFKVAGETQPHVEPIEQNPEGQEPEESADARILRELEEHDLTNYARNTNTHRPSHDELFDSSDDESDILGQLANTTEPNTQPPREPRQPQVHNLFDDVGDFVQRPSRFGTLFGFAPPPPIDAFNHYHLDIINNIIPGPLTQHGSQGHPNRHPPHFTNIMRFRSR